MTKARLARLLEVATSSITRWESGARRPTGDMLVRIVARCGIPVLELCPSIAALHAPTQPSAEAAQ
jgi:transcriptional regulator with XRE-family HTH domain